MPASVSSEPFKVLATSLRQSGFAAHGDRLQAVLARWDGILARTPHGARAALVDALEGLVEAGVPSPFVPPALRSRGKHGSPD